MSETVNTVHSRTADAIEAARAAGRTALIGYLPAGYPTVEDSIEAAVALGNNGADVIEIGIPYSDPVMDGPVIQAATSQVLADGFRIDSVFDIVKAVSARTDAVVLVMTYWNIVDRMGVDTFARRLSEAGGAGIITPDLIPEEADEWRAASERHGLDRIFLVAPSSTTERIAVVAGASSGFVYTASTMGVTGARGAVGGAAPELASRVRSATDLPVCIGLGVSTRAQAAEVASFADGVIVGSALVSTLLDRGHDEGLAALAALTRELAEGVRGRA